MVYEFPMPVSTAGILLGRDGGSSQRGDYDVYTGGRDVSRFFRAEAGHLAETPRM
jgi:hypothetical protein